jgi:hypothetical protein
MKRVLTATTISETPVRDRDSPFNRDVTMNSDEHYGGAGMTVPAKYENGVFRPLDPVQIEEGTIVEVYVPAGPQRSGPRPRSVREFAFCGMWKDREDMADSVEYINRLRENLRG